VAESRFNDQGVPRVLPRGRHALSREVVRASQRQRLLEAAATVANEKGFAAMTITDVVAHAGTSRRAFYDHFESKEECSLAAFTMIADDLLRVTAERFDPSLDQAGRARIVIDSFLDYLAAHPVYAWFYFVDVNTIGSAGVARRHDIQRRIAKMIVALRRDVRRGQPEIPPLSEQHALAIVGGVDHIASQALHERGAERLGELSAELVPLVVSLLGTSTPPRRASRAPAPRADAARSASGSAFQR
jgi:AcrR family transcriptional regulator